MNFNLLYQHLFELLNFLFLCACITYAYRKYGAQKLTQVMQAEKDIVQALKQSVAHTQQQVAVLEHAITDQDTYAQGLLKNIALWSQKEEHKKRAVAQECAYLKKEFTLYLEAQEKAIALSELKRDTSARALQQARELLTQQYKDQQKQQDAVRRVYTNCVKGMQRG